jgi:putative acetyltransferase
MVRQLIRAEEAADYAGIREVNLLAFGQPTEADLVEALRREPRFCPELSLVAVQNDAVVGHILFSPIQVGKSAALALAPMAVRPELQRQGIGSELVRAGLGTCARLGHQVVVVVGHPEFYPRFGFVPARPHGIEAPFPVPDEAFMVREISPGGLAGVSGMVIYPAPFSAV